MQTEISMFPQTGNVAKAMKVSLDGGETFQEAKEGVRIIYEGVLIDDEHGFGELHLNATHEGLISDLWTTREEPLDHNLGTGCQLVDDMVMELVDGDFYVAKQEETTMPPNKGSNLVAMLIDTAGKSMDELRDRISNVRDAPMATIVEKNCECIHFDFDGKTYLGELRGRNRDFCINPADPGAQANRAIALRVMLDQHATLLEQAEV